MVEQRVVVPLARVQFPVAAPLKNQCIAHWFFSLIRKEKTEIRKQSARGGRKNKRTDADENRVIE